MKKLTIVSFIVCIAFVVCPAVAAPTIFTDRAAFNAATGGGLNFESFESDFAVTDSKVFSGFTVSETGGINAIGQARNFSWAGMFITDGTGALIYDDNGQSVGTFFAFSSPINAFGLDITVDESSTMAIGGSVNSSLILASGTPSFWGVIDMAGIGSITFNASGGPNVGFDAASYGCVSPTVPAPGAILLGGIGVSLVGWMRRKRA